MLIARLVRGYRIPALLGLLLFATACSKEEPEPVAGSSWLVDGQEETSDAITVDGSNNELQIDIARRFSSSTGVGSAVAVSLRVPKKTGTYNLAASGTQASASYSNNKGDGQSSDLYLATSGSVTISTLTVTAVVGTFSFTGTGFSNPQVTKSITNGKFRADL